MVIYIVNKIVYNFKQYNFPTSVCKAFVYVMQVYLYTMTNYSTHFTGADPGFPTRKGCGGGGGGGGGLVHCDGACIGGPKSCRWEWGRWDAGRGCTENYFHFKALETLFFILDPSQNGCSTVDKSSKPSYEYNTVPQYCYIASYLSMDRIFGPTASSAQCSK